MDAVKSPDGLWAIYEEDAAGFTSLKLSEGQVRARLAAAGIGKEEIDGAIAAPRRTWGECLARIRQIFEPAAGAHPCVVQALKRALENRMSTVVRELGAKAI